MEEAERLAEDDDQDLLLVGSQCGAPHLFEEDWLDDLDVVGAKLLPEKIVSLEGGVVKGVGLQVFLDLSCRFGHGGEDPLIF